MRRLVISVTAIGLALASANEVAACTCATPPPPKVALRHAGAVFSGKVVRVARSSSLPKYTLDVTIEAERIWKGPAVSVFVVETPRGGGACGYPFKVGERYLVYCGYMGLHELRSPMRLATGLCTRTKPLGDAAADIEALGKGRTVEDHRNVASKLMTTRGWYVGTSQVPLGVQYAGGLQGWKGHIGVDAEKGVVELSGDVYFRVTNRLGEDLKPRTEFRRLLESTPRTAAFSTFIDLAQMYDLQASRIRTDGANQPTSFIVTWGCDGVAEQSSYVVVLPEK